MCVFVFVCGYRIRGLCSYLMVALLLQKITLDLRDSVCLTNTYTPLSLLSPPQIPSLASSLPPVCLHFSSSL